MSNAPLIAIVDDDEAIREAIYDLLQVEGYAARTFGSGAELLTHPGVEGFACIISDVRMKGIDGLDMQKRLHARGLRTPMIFITSTMEDAARASALRGGASAWFTKPVADEELLVALRTALERPGGIR